MDKINTKMYELDSLMDELNLNPEQIAFVGNDLNDLEAIKFFEYTFCPSDSCPEVFGSAKYVLPVRGGDGVIYEMWKKMLEEGLL